MSENEMTGSTGMNPSDKTPEVDNLKPVPPASDGANVARRRFATPAPGTPCQRGVIEFPARGTGLGRVPLQGRTGMVHRTKEWLAWGDTDTSDDGSVLLRLDATEPSVPGGFHSAGVLMPLLALPADLSGYRHNDPGLLAHAVIATIAPEFN